MECRHGRPRYMGMRTINKHSRNDKHLSQTILSEKTWYIAAAVARWSSGRESRGQRRQLAAWRVRTEIPRHSLIYQVKAEVQAIHSCSLNLTLNGWTVRSCL